VYEESLQQYSKVEMIARQVIDDALSVISDKISGDIFIVNPTSFPRSDIAFLPDKNHETPGLQHKDGSDVLLQQTERGYLIDAGSIPPYNITGLKFTSHEAKQSGNQSNLVATPGLLENEVLRIELNQNGDIIRIYDKENNREVLPLGALANQFQAFEDRPRTPDAWEIDIYYDDKVWFADPPTSIETFETGPLRATIQIQRRILSSEVLQRISINRESRRIDFETTIHWREKHTLLKVAFPVNVLSPKATYEIQWGNVERPTHRNTSWDWARFETCAQKWVDLSEGDYGVSLLNDSKYGHDILGNVMRLSLLRSPTTPDPNADQGEHRFVYSLLPHSGGWDTSTISEAYALNDPLIVFKATSEDGSPENPTETDIHTNGSWSFLQVDQPNVVIETIKKAEDGRGLIVRMYESKRHRGSCNLRFGFPTNEVWRTNLIEEDLGAISVKDAAVSIEFNPYQIITLRVIPT
jgi:alpha-mannosidase